MPKFLSLGPAHYTVQKWKNGAGTTSELFIEPSRAKFPLDPYLWRISSARVNASGPFSLFPGYDRALVLVEGESLELRPLGKLAPFEIALFEGEREIFSESGGAELIDYNVFWKRNLVEGTCEVLDASALREWSKPKVGSLGIVITAVRGGVSVIESLGEPRKLGLWESLRIDFRADEHGPPLNLKFELAAPGDRAILSSFRPRVH